MDLFEYAETQLQRETAAPPVQNPYIVPAESLPSEFIAICNVIREHRGAASAITALDVARAANVRPQGTAGSRARVVREIIEIYFRSIDFPLVADSNGFYHAVTDREVEHYHANLYSRLAKIAKRIRAHRIHAQAAGYTYRGHGRYQRREVSISQHSQSA